MTNIKEQVKELLWDLIEKHYNVDRKYGHILIGKYPASNGIDKVGQELGGIIEELLSIQVKPQNVDKELIQPPPLSKTQKDVDKATDEDIILETYDWLEY